MINHIVSVVLGIVGIINLLPLIVFFDANKTVKLYGVPVEGTSMTILMRHRGVLLGLIGLALITAAFKSEYRTLAISLALISKIAFIFLTFSSENHTSEIKQVALIDVTAVVLLLFALALHFYGK